MEDKKSVYESIRKFVEMINMGDVRCSRLRRYAEKILVGSLQSMCNNKEKNNNNKWRIKGVCSLLMYIIIRKEGREMLNDKYVL